MAALLYLVMKASPVMLAAATGLCVWRFFGAPDPVASLIVVTAVLAGAGFICHAIRRYRSDVAGLLLEALKATRQTPTGPGLHLVDPQETRSSTHADRRTAR